MKSESPVRIHCYNEEYADSHADFARQMWAHKARRRSEAFNRWKYRAKPEGEVTGLILAVCEGRVVGQVGLVPAILRSGNREKKCGWVCDFMVAPHFRGRGLGPRLLKAAIETQEVVLGLNPTASSMAVHSRTGFVNFCGPKLMLLPLKINEMLKWKIKKIFWPLIPTVAGFVRPLLPLRSGCLMAKQINDFRVCGLKRVAELVRKRQAAYKEPYILHDEEFLFWRFNPPVNERSGMIAVCNSSVSYALIETTPLYLYVSDWFAEDAPSRLALFQKIYQLAREANSEIIQVLSREEDKQWLATIGFMETSRSETVLLYPGRLLAEYEKIKITLMDSDCGDM